MCRICKNNRIYLHICRIFSHMRSHFSALFLFNVVLRLLNILVVNDYRYLQLDIEKIEVKNVKTVQKRPTNDHD